MDIKTKMPIARVTVLNKNTSTVVLASENGDFEIFAKTNDKLLFSHLGYNYAEVGVNQKSYSGIQTVFLSYKENEIETERMIFLGLIINEIISNTFKFEIGNGNKIIIDINIQSINGIIEIQFDI